MSRGIDTRWSEDLSTAKLLVAGGQLAWADFCSKHTTLVYSAIRGTLARYGLFTVSNDDVDDVHAGILACLIDDDYRRLRQFKGECSLASWLHLISVRRTIDYIRSRPPDAIPLDQPSADGELIGAPEQPDEHSLSPQERLLEKESIEVVRQCVAALSPRERTVLAYYCDGRSAEDVGRIMHIKPNHVYQLQHRALQHVREAMKKKGCLA